MPFGRGFGFRGWSPGWPYVGLGRGGLPRCWAYPYMGRAIGRMGPVSPSIQPPTKEEEIRNLKERARVLEEQLEAIEKRIKDLDKEGA